MENDLREAGNRQQATGCQLQRVCVGRGTCCTAGSFSEYSPSNCQEKYFSISSSGRKRNEKNLKIHKTKQQKTPADCPHSHSPSISHLTGMCCNSVSALACSGTALGLLWVCSDLPANRQHCASFFSAFSTASAFCLFAQMRELFIFPIFPANSVANQRCLLLSQLLCIEHMSAICKSNAQKKNQNTPQYPRTPTLPPFSSCFMLVFT